jgi:hypothetical protein
MLTSTPRRTFNQVAEMYNAIIPGAFQRHPRGYIFAFQCRENQHFSYARFFSKLDRAIAEFEAVEARFQEVKARAEAYLSQQPVQPPRSCKVCVHRRVEVEGFGCNAKSSAIGLYLYSEDLGADGCRLFKERDYS